MEYPVGRWKLFGEPDQENGTIVILKDDDELTFEETTGGIQAGGYRWHIPWEYAVQEDPDNRDEEKIKRISTPVRFTTVTHHAWKNAANDVTIEKGNGGPQTKKLNDPTT